MSDTAASMVPVYECGCNANQAGQAFDHGLLVCPQHREPVAPFERPAQPFRHTLSLEIEFESLDEKYAQWAREQIEKRIEHVDASSYTSVLTVKS